MIIYKGHRSYDSRYIKNRGRTLNIVVNKISGLLLLLVEKVISLSLTSSPTLEWKLLPSDLLNR